MGTFREQLHALITHVLADFQKPIVAEFPGAIPRLKFDAVEIKLRVIQAVIQTVQAFLTKSGSAPDITTLPETHIHVTQFASQPWCKVEFSPEFEARIDAFDKPESDEPDIIARIEAILTRLDTHLNKLDRLFPASGNPLAFNTASPPLVFNPAPPKVVHHIYLAGPWDARITIDTVADLLRIDGHIIVSKWHEPRFDGRDGTPGIFHAKKDVEAYEMNGTAIDVATIMVVFPYTSPTGKGGRETWFDAARFRTDPCNTPRDRRLYVFTSKVLPLTLRVTKHPMTVLSDKGGGVAAAAEYSRALIEAFRVSDLVAGVKSCSLSSKTVRPPSRRSRGCSATSAPRVSTSCGCVQRRPSSSSCNNSPTASGPSA